MFFTCSLQPPKSVNVIFGLGIFHPHAQFILRKIHLLSSVLVPQHFDHRQTHVVVQRRGTARRQRQPQRVGRPRRRRALGRRLPRERGRRRRPEWPRRVYLIFYYLNNINECIINITNMLLTTCCLKHVVDFCYNLLLTTITTVNKY